MAANQVAKDLGTKADSMNSGNIYAPGTSCHCTKEDAFYNVFQAEFIAETSNEDRVLRKRGHKKQVVAEPGRQAGRQTQSLISAMETNCPVQIKAFEVGIRVCPGRSSA